MLRRIKCKGRAAWENNWVILNQWDINTLLGFSDCLAASFFINESGHPIIPGDLRLIKAKHLQAQVYFTNGQTTVPEMFGNAPGVF